MKDMADLATIFASDILLATLLLYVNMKTPTSRVTRFVTFVLMWGCILEALLVSGTMVRQVY